MKVMSSDKFRHLCARFDVMFGWFIALYDSLLGWDFVCIPPTYVDRYDCERLQRSGPSSMDMT